MERGSRSPEGWLLVAPKPANRTYVGPYPTFHVAVVADRKFCDQVNGCKARSPASRPSGGADRGAKQ